MKKSPNEIIREVAAGSAVVSIGALSLTGCSPELSGKDVSATSAETATTAKLFEYNRAESTDAIGEAIKKLEEVETSGSLSSYLKDPERNAYISKALQEAAPLAFDTIGLIEKELDTIMYEDIDRGGVRSGDQTAWKHSFSVQPNEFRSTTDKDSFLLMTYGEPDPTKYSPLVELIVRRGNEGNPATTFQRERVNGIYANDFTPWTSVINKKENGVWTGIRSGLGNHAPGVVAAESAKTANAYDVAALKQLLESLNALQADAKKATS